MNEQSKPYQEAYFHKIGVFVSDVSINANVRTRPWAHGRDIFVCYASIDVDLT
jgi:hypothetical protein